MVLHTLALSPTNKVGLLLAYEVFEEKPGEFVALFHSTIALGPNGTTRLAGPTTFDESKVKSDKSLQDEDLKKMIAAPLKAAKPKKKKSKKEGAESQGEEEVKEEAKPE